MRRFLVPVLLSYLLLVPAAYAEEAPKPDDRVAFDLSGEDWVTTKTARVSVAIEAAVSAANAGTMRSDMAKTVENLANGEWRLVNFIRRQDQTGLERWSAVFEARLPESGLGGLNENAKKLSKAGMQLSVASVDFSPTLDEFEAARSTLRAQIYKKAADQLATLNAALPGRGYRIASLDFSNEGEGVVVPQMRSAPFAVAAMADQAAPEPDMKRSEKIKLMAHVVLAALPPVVEAKR